MRFAHSIRVRRALVGLAVGLALGGPGCSGNSGTQATAEEAVVKSQQRSAELKKEQAKARMQSKSKSRGMPGAPGD